MKHSVYVPLLGAALLLLSSCAHYRESNTWRRPGMLGSDIPSYTPLVEPGAPPDSVALPEPTGTLSLSRALSLALMQNPELASFAWEVRSAEAGALQVGIMPNPELEIEMEDLTDEGFDDAITSVHLSQSIELGGKRRKRSQVAHLEADAAGWDYQAARLDVLTGTTKAFVEVGVAQERLVLSEELHELAKQTLAIVRRRVEAGKDSPLEEIRAEISIESAQIEERKVRGELMAARKRLAAHWGSRVPAFDRVEADLFDLKPVPALRGLSERVSQSPELVGWDVTIKQLEGVVELEKANRIPDLDVGAGIEYSNAEQETAYRIGVAAPVPLFDRNQGAVLEAQCNLAGARKMRDGAEVAVLAELTDAYERLASAYDEAVVLRDDILPAAEKTFEGTSDGFLRGRYGYLEVLDVQRTLFELKSQYVEALATYHSSRADVERVIAQSLDEMTE